jgi:TRAP-type C4-dicarboxylate transport system substrate-binding protein
MVRKTLSRRTLAVALLAALLAAVPGGAKVAATNKQVLKFALLVPRTPELVIEEKKYNKRLGELTDGQVQVRVYWGGAAGDEQDVVRKMRTGQMDRAERLLADRLQRRPDHFWLHRRRAGAASSSS